MLEAAGSDTTGCLRRWPRRRGERAVVQSSWQNDVPALDMWKAPVEYVDWHRDELVIRAFLINSNIGMTAWFEECWREAEQHANTIFDPDIHDAALVYDTFTDNAAMDPAEYFWQLSAAVVKDACALYEVLLEQLPRRALAHRGLRLVKLSTEDSWRRGECSLFYRHYFGLEVMPIPVNDVLWMRDKLAHLRDELRTPQGLQDFLSRLHRLGVTGPATDAEKALPLSDDEPFLQGVALSQMATWKVLDIVRKQANTVASGMFSYTHGDASTPHLDALAAGTPLRVKNLPINNLVAHAR